MSSLLVPNSAWVLGLGWFYDCLIFLPSLAKYSLPWESLETLQQMQQFLLGIIRSTSQLGVLEPG